MPSGRPAGVPRRTAEVVALGTAEVVALGAAPTLAVLYAQGALGSVAALLRPGTVRRDSLPTTRLTLARVRPDAGHLTAYQHLVGEPATDDLPPGFVHVLAFPMTMALMVRPDFPLPLLGMVHVANRVEQRRALRLGEELDIRVHARELRSHRAGVTVDLVAEVAVGDDVVWQGVSTYLSKGARLSGAAVGAGAGEAEDAGADATDAGDARARPPFAPPVPTGQWRLAADIGRRYAAVSGDRNPIHLSPLAARALGFPRTIAHGMYTAARALADVGSARGDALVWTVEFAKPVLLPSTVTVRVAADARGSTPGFTFVGWDARRARVHLTGSVTPLPVNIGASVSVLSRREMRAALA